MSDKSRVSQQEEASSKFRGKAANLKIRSLRVAAITFMHVCVIDAALECAIAKTSTFITVTKTLQLVADGTGIAVTWSRDGKFLAAVSRYGTTISVWDMNGSIKHTIRSRGEGNLKNSIGLIDSGHKVLSSLAEHPSYMRASTGTFIKQTINIWDLATKHVVVSEGSSGGLEDFVLSPREDVVIATEKQKRLLRILSMPLLESLGAITTSGFPASMAFFPDEHRLAVGFYDGNTAIFDIQGLREIARFSQFGKLFTSANTKLGEENIDVSGMVAAIAVDATGKHIATGAGLLTINPVLTMSSATTATLTYNPLSAEQWINNLSTVTVWDAKAVRQVAAYPGHAHAPIRQIVWHPDGSFLIFCDSANRLVFWNPFDKSVQPVEVELESTAMSLAISPSGEMLAVTTNSGLDLYKLKRS